MCMNTLSLLDGRYQLTGTLSRRHGERHFAARHVELDLPVRIAVLGSPAGDAPAGHAWARRVWAQAAQATRLRHPCLPRVRDCFVQESTVAVVLEWVEGEPLAERLRRQGQLAPREALSYALQVCDALSIAARQAPALLPAESLTPENLVVVAPGRLMVADPGVGRWAARAAVPGTIRHDPQTEIVAVAELLYLLLTGDPPLRGEAYVPLSLREPRLAPGLAPALDRALARSGAPRYPSTDAFARALGEAARAALPARAGRTHPAHARSAAAPAAAAREAAERRALHLAGGRRLAGGGRLAHWPRLVAQSLASTWHEAVRRQRAWALEALTTTLRQGA
jgi:hypothetical protein